MANLLFLTILKDRAVYPQNIFLTTIIRRINFNITTTIFLKQFKMIITTLALTLLK
jgi:hypothetical protein